MRRTLLLSAVLAACATNDAAESDSAEAMADGSALRALDVAGTWVGTSTEETGDSVTSRWTLVSVDDTTSILLVEGLPDTIRSHVAYGGDSLIATSEPYTSPTVPGAQVTYHSVGRLENGVLRGMVTFRLASNPDSVVGRNRWEATRP